MSFTAPPGYSTLSQTPPPGLLAGPLNAGWYVVKTTTGYIGLVLHHTSGQSINLGPSSYGEVTNAKLVGSPSEHIYDVLGATSTEVMSALESFGATGKQSTAFIVQADTAAGKQQGKPVGGVWGFITGLVGATPFSAGKQTTQLLINPSGKPTASSGTTPVSTTPSGDVQGVGASVNPTSPFAFLANLSFWKGIGLVLGGALILIFVGLMLYKGQK